MVFGIKYWSWSYNIKQNHYVMSCLFCFCHAKISLTMGLHAMLLVSLESRGEPTWFETLWSYDVEADYRTIFSMKTKQNWNWKPYWNLGVFFMLLESLQQVRFNKFYFKIFRAKVWKILICEWVLLLKIQTNCKKWVWIEKSVESPQCVHTWVNGTNYTSYVKVVTSIFLICSSNLSLIMHLTWF